MTDGPALTITTVYGVEDTISAIETFDGLSEE